MALVRINKNPSAKDLKWFGALFGAFFGLAGALVWWRSGSERFATILWTLAVVVPVIYYALPPLRRPCRIAGNIREDTFYIAARAGIRWPGGFNDKITFITHPVRHSYVSSLYFT